MNVDKEILQEFKKLTRFDIELLLSNAKIFFTQDYHRIVAFYSGERSTIDKGVFDNFDEIERQCNSVFSAFHEVSGRLSNVKWWDLLTLIEEIDSRLKTLRKINKWSRSSLRGVGYDPSYQLTYITKEHQTIERVSQDVLSNDSTDGWYDITVSNHLKEENYTPSGGVELELNFPNVNRGIQVNSVVAVMEGKAIYGKDIYRKIQIDPVTEDLTVLDYDQTIQQSVEILSQLKRNDNPAYPNDGIQREVIIGGNRATLNFPIFQRQQNAVFATDDTLKKFTIKSLSFNEDQLLLDFEVSTRLDEVVSSNTILV